jgi:hypothetical protein
MVPIAERTVSVDTPADLMLAEKLMQDDELRKLYAK